LSSSPFAYQFSSKYLSYSTSNSHSPTSHFLFFPPRSPSFSSSLHYPFLLVSKFSSSSSFLSISFFLLYYSFSSFLLPLYSTPDSLTSCISFPLQSSCFLIILIFSFNSSVRLAQVRAVRNSNVATRKSVSDLHSCVFKV
jgi:hypothetical protein